MEINLFQHVKHAFCNGEEYKSILRDYKIALSQLQTNENVYKIFLLERILKNKNIADVMYSLQKGYARDIAPDEVDIFEKGVEETIDFNPIFSTDSYIHLRAKVNEAKKDVLTAFETENEIIEKLFEIYSAVNFELIKTAYAIGYEIQKNNKELQCLKIFSVNT